MKNILLIVVGFVAGTVLRAVAADLPSVTHRRTQTVIVGRQDVKVEHLYMSDGSVRWEASK